LQAPKQNLNEDQKKKIITFILLIASLTPHLWFASIDNFRSHPISSLIIAALLRSIEFLLLGERKREKENERERRKTNNLERSRIKTER
jgi:hypothetical protein